MERCGASVGFRALVLSAYLGIGMTGCDDGAVDPPMDAGGGGGTDAGGGGTDAGGGGTDAGPPMCGPDTRTARLVYFGTAAPTSVPWSAGQILAVVDFDGCSGSFVNDEWVLTATHCGVDVGRRLCVGPDAANANVCFTADRVENHPNVDLTLVHVDAPASTRIAELEPIPVMTTPVDATWVGRTAEAAGYGTQEDGSIGEREFTAEPIASIDGEYVTIDGMGVHGVCFGDSGGPVTVLADDGTVRVLGALSFGDASCVGQDTFTRVDVVIEWVEAITGPTIVTGAGCGRITDVGDCLGARTAVWCDETTSMLATETCAAGQTCGWDTSSASFRCVTDDPCQGVSAAGACQGTTAVWCDEGTLRRRGCGACGELCRYVSDISGFYCRPDPCIGLDPMGTCDGTILTTCDPDVGVMMQDCAARGRVCGFSTRRGQNACIRG
ncbi:MAG: trypsin-like serine protease [Sandaracinaceae bacterium]